MNIAAIFTVAKGLALVLALYVAFTLGQDSVKLDVANKALVKVENDDKITDTIASKSDERILDGLRKYSRD